MGALRKATAVHSCWHAQPFPDIFVCVSVEAHLSASTIGGAVACWSCATSQPVGKAALFPGSFFFSGGLPYEDVSSGQAHHLGSPPPPSPSGPSPPKAHHAACTAATWAMVESWSPPRVARQKGERPDATVGGMSSGGRGGEAAPGVAVNAPCVRMGLCTSLPSPSGGARRGQPWRPPPARAAEAAYSHSSSGGRRGCRQRRGRPHAHPGVVATRCHLSPPHHSPPSPAVVGERAPPLRAMTHQPPPSPSSPVVAATVATLPCACLPSTLPDVLVTTVGAGRRRGVAQLSPSPPQLLDHPPTRHSPPAVCLHVRPSLCRRCVVEGRVVESRGDSSFRCSRYGVQPRTLVTLPESEAGRMGIVEEAGEESGTATRGEVGSDGGPRRATQGGRTRARGVASRWGNVPPHTRSPGGVSTLRLTPPTRSDPLNSAPLRPTPLV